VIFADPLATPGTILLNGNQAVNALADGGPPPAGGPCKLCPNPAQSASCYSARSTCSVGAGRYAIPSSGSAGSSSQYRNSSKLREEWRIFLDSIWPIMTG